MRRIVELKNIRNKNIPLKWLWILLIQMASLLLLSLLLERTYYLSIALHTICTWAIFPIAGMFSACFATRKGLLNYVAWFIPPAMQFLGYFISWPYFIKPGPVFLCAFISLIGAAAGEVLKKRDKH